MTERRNVMLRDWVQFSAALRSLADGEDTDDAVAARGVLAETILIHRKWLEAQFKQGS